MFSEHESTEDSNNPGFPKTFNVPIRVNRRNQGKCEGVKSVVMDEKGFLKTRSDFSALAPAQVRWPGTHNPYLLETSQPGVFAVSAVRSDNITRVATAVREDQWPFIWYTRSSRNGKPRFRKDDR